MSTSIHPAITDGNRTLNAPLILLLGEQRQRIETLPSLLADVHGAHASLSSARASDSGTIPATFVVSAILEWSDDDRFLVLRFLAGVHDADIQLSETGPAFGLFETVLAAMEGPQDVGRCGRGRQAAIETAALLHGNSIHPAATRIADRLRELGLRSVRVESIAREIGQLARSLGATNMGAQRDGVCVRDTLQDAPCPENAVVPAAWRLDASGISRRDQAGVEPLVSTPIVISARRINIHDGTVWLEVAWVGDRGWARTVVRRATVATARGVVELAAYGLPVTSNNAPDVVQYLADFEAENLAMLPSSRISPKLGWMEVDGHPAFLWGRVLLTRETCGDPEGRLSNQPIVFVGADTGDEQVVNGFRAQGTLDGWFNALRPVANYPAVQLAVYASLSPPLLEILDAPNFTLNYGGATSRGKTTAQGIAASLWGCPDERSPSAAIFGWDSTRVFIERLMALLDCLPVILDDTKRARDKRDPSQIVYDVASGRGRQRGSRDGIARSGTGRTVLISSGEAPLTSATQDGGARARVLDVWGGPFGEPSAETAQVLVLLTDQIRQHFGFAGPRFVQHLLAHLDQWPTWRQEYQRYRQAYRERAGSNAVALRMADHFATLEIAAWLAHGFGLLPWSYVGAIAAMWPQITAETDEADRSAAALRHVYSWAVSHVAEFFGASNSQFAPHAGWAGRWDVGRTAANTWEWLGVFPHLLDKVLTDGGYDPVATLLNWHERGWLRVDADGRRQFRTRVAGTPARLLAIRRSAIEEATGQSLAAGVGPLLTHPAATNRENGTAVGTGSGTM